MAHIISILSGALEALLVAACQTAISDDDDSKALLVRAGRLQEDPTKNFVNVLIHPNDPDDMDEWVHEVIGKNITPYSDHGFPIGMYEIGGGEQWWRRFTAELKIFYNQKSLTRTQARDNAHLVLGRAEEAIKEGISALAASPDTWGEQAWGAYVRRSRCVERGGPTKDWIWDGKIWVEIGTSKP